MCSKHCASNFKTALFIMEKKKLKTNPNSHKTKINWNHAGKLTITWQVTSESHTVADMNFRGLVDGKKQDINADVINMSPLKVKQIYSAERRLKQENPLWGEGIVKSQRSGRQNLLQ